MSKERLLKKHHGINYVMNGNTMNAMDEFAEIRALEFMLWCADNGFILHPFPNKRTGIRMFTQIKGETDYPESYQTFTPKQVYAQFELNSKNR